MSVQFLSNDFEDFEQGGLYPGGKGVITQLQYVLWDYDGKRAPQSQTAVFCLFTPTDGSNDGKPVPIHWSVGPASEFAPDPTGGFLVAVGARKGVSASSNWHFVQAKFKGCSLETKNLNGPTGIRILENTQATLTRMDQPTREGLEADTESGDAKDKKGNRKAPTILIPTHCVFPWERGGARPPVPASAPASAPAPGPVAVPYSGAPAVQSPTPSSAQAGVGGPTNLTPGPGPTDMATALSAALDQNGGVIPFDKLGNAVMNVTPDMPRLTRMEIIKQSKDPVAISVLAAAQGWMFDGKELMKV